MGVSKNRSIPKSSILIGFSIINHPFWGTPIFGNIHMFLFGTQPKLLKQKNLHASTTTPQKQIQGVHPKNVTSDESTTYLEKRKIIKRSPFRLFFFPFFSFQFCFLQPINFKRVFRRFLFGHIVIYLVSPFFLQKRTAWKMGQHFN